jgi:hypothetical protein
MYSHFGACSIVKYEFFKEKLNEMYKETTEELVNKNIKCFDDILYTYAALINGFQYLRIKNYSIKNYVYKYKFQDYLLVIYKLRKKLYMKDDINI